MKTLFFCWLLLLGGWVSAIADGLVQEAQTPVQVYQTAGDNPALPAAQEEMPAPALASNLPADVAVSKESEQALQDQLDAFDRANVIYRQGVDSRLETLAAQINLLGNHLNKVDITINSLSDQLAQLSAQTKVTPKTEHAGILTIIASFFTQLQFHLGVKSFYFLLLICIISVITIFWFIRPRSRKNLVRSQNNGKELLVPNEQDDYDYLGSYEGVPAKLNLARAYFAMEDYRSAEHIIAEILTHGNNMQQEQARALLAQIKHVRA